MNETRKEIISLISDYMDKTLSEGCLFYNNFNKRIVKIQEGGTFSEDENGKYYEKYFDLHSIDKIIGHYDITAVLKYIKDNGGKEIKIDASGEIEIYNQYVGYVYLSNKPLHLYTEQEEKELLDLLLKG